MDMLHTCMHACTMSDGVVAYWNFLILRCDILQHQQLLVSKMHNALHFFCTCFSGLTSATRLQLQSCQVILVHQQLLRFMMSLLQGNHTNIPGANWCFSGCTLFQMETCQPLPGIPQLGCWSPRSTIHFFHAQLQWCHKCNNAPAAHLSVTACASATAELYDAPIARHSHQHPSCNIFLVRLQLLTCRLYNVSNAKHSHQHSSCIGTLLSVLCCGELFCAVLFCSFSLVSSCLVRYVSFHLVRKRFIV